MRVSQLAGRRLLPRRVSVAALMRLSRHPVSGGSRWAIDGQLVDTSFELSALLTQSEAEMQTTLRDWPRGANAPTATLPPIESSQEVWASGVTYLRSRQARRAESDVADVYDRVYSAVRPELFFKAPGWRVVGDGAEIGTRSDSAWLVPEPELTLVLNSRGQVVGYSAGNDVSCRDIEGENPLYLPQAKVFDGSCAIGPSIRIAVAADLLDSPIRLVIERGQQTVFEGSTRTSRIKRSLDELSEHLMRHLSFPHGAFLMTGTGIVPPDDFCLRSGDVVKVAVGELLLTNRVASPNLDLTSKPPKSQET